MRQKDLPLRLHPYWRLQGKVLVGPAGGGEPALVPGRGQGVPLPQHVGSSPHRAAPLGHLGPRQGDPGHGGGPLGGGGGSREGRSGDPARPAGPGLARPDLVLASPHPLWSLALALRRPGLPALQPRSPHVYSTKLT